MSGGSAVVFRENETEVALAPPRKFLPNLRFLFAKARRKSFKFGIIEAESGVKAFCSFEWAISAFQ